MVALSMCLLGLLYHLFFAPFDVDVFLYYFSDSAKNNCRPSSSITVVSQQHLVTGLSASHKQCLGANAGLSKLTTKFQGTRFYTKPVFQKPGLEVIENTKVE